MLSGIKKVLTYRGRLTSFEPAGPRGGFESMGRKRDLKNFNRKPKIEDWDALDDWGDDMNIMTSRRRRHNERHKPASNSRTP